jgi:ribonuclease VapC
LQEGYRPLLEMMSAEPGLLPAPVVVEFERVTALGGNLPDPDAAELLRELLDGEMQIVSFTADDARLAMSANQAWRSGNGRGGPLNILDLMVYAVAKRTGRPILCTGRDSAATDAAVHPASRID